MRKRIKRIGLRLSSYVVIGGFTTGGMWVTWNLLYLATRKLNLDPGASFSVTQYLASGIWILPSFYLNRKLTFKDKALSGGKTLTLGKIILIYNLAPIVASFATFAVHSIFSLDFESLTFILVLAGKSLTIPYAYFGLQAFGMGLSLLLNFFGQYFLVYQDKKEDASSAPVIS